MNGGTRRIVIMTTSFVTLRTFLQAQLALLRDEGFDAYAVCGESGDVPRALAGVPVMQAPLVRAMSLALDLRAVIALYRLLRDIRPAIVHTHTPKAGLLGMLAARMAGVPVRIYTVNGLVLETRHGWRRRLLMGTERVAAASATQVLAVSRSVAERMRELRLSPRRAPEVIGWGGSHGVDLERFDPARFDGEARLDVRRGFGVPPRAPLLLFAGRLARDKGLAQLVAAWTLLAGRRADAHLLLCGTHEARDAESARALAALSADPRVRVAGFQPDMARVIAACDVCLLPTLREGMPNIALECAAMRVPVVANRVTGCVDAVAEGVSGVLVDPGDAAAMADAALRLIEERDGTASLSREWVAERFAERTVNALYVLNYRAQLERTS